MYEKPCNADMRDVTEKSALWTRFPLSSLELQSSFKKLRALKLVQSQHTNISDSHCLNLQK